MQAFSLPLPCPEPVQSLWGTRLSGGLPAAGARDSSGPGAPGVGGAKPDSTNDNKLQHINNNIASDSRRSRCQYLLGTVVRRSLFNYVIKVSFITIINSTYWFIVNSHCHEGRKYV